MGNIFAATVSAIAMTLTIPQQITPSHISNAVVIITNFELDTSRKIVDYEDPIAHSYWDEMKSNGDVDLTNVKFIPVKYKTFNMLFPAYIPEFLFVNPIPQSKETLSPIEIKIGDEYILYLSCRYYDEELLNQMK